MKKAHSQLDEIGEMDMSLQSKLLRTLQEGEIERVGGAKPLKVDVRIIAATNKNLESEVAHKSFREDLYYRLSVFPITIPPLKERKEDIPSLVEYFVSKYSAEMKIPQKNITPDTMEILKNYTWKGNIRELENVIERALILCEGDTIIQEHLRLAPSVAHMGTLQNIPLNGTLNEAASVALRIAETLRIKKALENTHGNKSRAAEQLKVSYKTLLTKIKEYRVEG
jgi:two-component system response regulator AtoC